MWFQARCFTSVRSGSSPVNWGISAYFHVLRWGLQKMHGIKENSFLNHLRLKMEGLLALIILKRKSEVSIPLEVVSDNYPAEKWPTKDSSSGKEMSQVQVPHTVPIKPESPRWKSVCSENGQVMLSCSVSPSVYLDSLLSTMRPLHANWEAQSCRKLGHHFR